MNNDFIIPFILSLISGLSTLIGSIFIFIKTNRIGDIITISLSFSMGIMIILSIFDLIPSSFINIINYYGIIYGLIISFLSFLLGYLTIFIINFKENKSKNNLYRIGMLSMISLIIHNIPEGIIVFMSSYHNIKIGINVCISIMLHNIPEGISIALPLYYSGESRGSVVKKVLLSGIIEPLGALLSYIFLKDYISPIIISYLLLFVSGLMISLSINDIYKEIKKYNNIKNMILGIILSIVLSIIII